nr:reverse transcriptase domain-containing protein [Tanacetum cinerariifolium]
MQTQTSNTLHNAIMEADSKDRPPMLAPGNHIQWKSRIKRYIDTKPNQELIHYCLENPPYELGWKEKAVLDSEGNLTTATERVFETYKNVKQEIRDQLNAEAEAVQIILTGVDNDINSTVDACPNACEMWKAIERLKQGESINVQDLETNLFWEFGKFTSLDGESLELYYLRDEQLRVRREATRAGGPARGLVTAPMAQDCSFDGFMKCGPTQFHGTKGAVGLVRWFEKMENTLEISECTEGNKVKFSTATLYGRTLTCWNSQVATLGREVANRITWAEVKQMMTDEFCPIEEVQRLEDELRYLKLRDMNIAAYTERFNELPLLCPDVVPNEKKKKIQAKNERIAEGLKRKWENNNQGNNNNNHNRGNYRNNNQNNNRRQNNARALTMAQNARANQTEIVPKCNRCGRCQFDQCPSKCENCGRLGHKAKDCQSNNVASGAAVQLNVVCYKCAERGHKSYERPKKAERKSGNVQGQAYVICDAEHNQGLNVVMELHATNNAKPKDITDPTTAMNMALALMGKAFKLNYSTPTNNNQRISSNLRNRQIAQPGNLKGYNDIQNVRNQNPNGNGNLVAARAEDRSTEVHNYQDFYDNEIFNMFTQEEQYTELLEPIHEPHQVTNNDNNVIFKVFSVEQSEETVEQHHANVEETRVLYDSLYNNLAIEVVKVNTVNRKLKETNAEFTTELTRFKIKKSVLKLVKKNMTNLKDVIRNLNKKLSMEKSTVSSPFEEKKKLKFDFKIHEDELLDKQIQLEKRIKELDNILVKTGQSIQTIHMLSPKPDSFYHTEQRMALGYQNPFYLKQAQQKQQSLYDEKVLLKKHDPPVVHDSKETLQLAQEKLHKIVKDEIFPIVNQVDTRVQNFEIQLLKEAAKFVGDFKSLAKEADESLAKHKALELEIERVDNTKTIRPQPRSNTKNDMVPSTSKSSRNKNKEVDVEEHHRKLLLSRNKKHMSSECNNIKLATQNATQICLWCVDSSCSKHMTRNLQLLINFVWKFLGTVRFRNDHVAAILGQFCDSDLEVAFRRNACFVRNLEGVDLLKGNSSANLYTINLHEMASASPICLMACASSTKSWLWHQRLSHLNFDTINDLAKNDLVSDADYAGCKDTFKSTSGGAQFLGESWAWYDELSMFLLHNHFFKGTIDPMLFIRRFDNDILVDSGFKLTGFLDADYAGCKDTFKSTSSGS